MADPDESQARLRHPARALFPQLSSNLPPVVVVPDSEVAGMTEARARALLRSSSAMFEAGRRAGRAEAVAMLEAHDAAVRAAGP